MTSSIHNDTDIAELQNKDYSHLIESMDSEDLLNGNFTTEFDIVDNDDAVDIFVTSPLHYTQEPKQPKIIPSSNPNIMIANDKYYDEKKNIRKIMSIRKDKSKRTVKINIQESTTTLPTWKELIPFETKNIPQESTDGNLKDPRKINENTQTDTSMEVNETNTTQMIETKDNTVTRTVIITSEKPRPNTTIICQIPEQNRKRKHSEDIRDRTKYYKLSPHWNYFKIIGGNINKGNGSFKYILKNCKDNGFRFQATEEQFELAEISSIIVTPTLTPTSTLTNVQIQTTTPTIQILTPTLQIQHLQYNNQL